MNKSNEEKAQEICEKQCRYNPPCSSLECYLSALEMAAWKDEQINEILKLVKPMIFGGHKIKIEEILGKDINWKEL